ncbi:MAG: CHAD domain-containing protein [Rhodoferax sp.]|nr:CHAD domain-containing protein [Rhodoferax sp.]
MQTLSTQALPRRAQPPDLPHDQALAAAAACVLAEMWGQFTTNLALLGALDDPEVVHQARIGWRRFKSALRLFKPALDVDTRPSWLPLQGLLKLLSELRELDVAGTDTLPSLESAFTAGNPRRANDWQVMTEALVHATASKRRAVRHALKNPRLCTALLDITEWLETIDTHGASVAKDSKLKIDLRPWARRRIARLRNQLKLHLKTPVSAENQHQTRIAAKRLRYGIETLRSLLPKRRAQRWYEQAVHLQSSLGTARDLVQVIELLGQMQVDAGLVEFLRGVAVGQGNLTTGAVRAAPATAP